MGFPPTRRRQVGAHNFGSCDHLSDAPRGYIAQLLVSGKRVATARGQRSLDRKRSVAGGPALFSCCILAGSRQQETKERFVESNRCTIPTLLVLTHSRLQQQCKLFAAFISASCRGSSSNSNMMMGALTSTVFLGLCPAMGNAFVVRARSPTPPDSAWKGQASSGLGPPLGVGGRRLGTDGALFPVSQAGCKDAEGYASWCSRSNSALHVSKGVEVRAYRRTLPSQSL